MCLHRGNVGPHESAQPVYHPSYQPGTIPTMQGGYMNCKVESQCKSESHNKHICYLKMQGSDDILRSVTDNPAVECRHCGAKANSLQYVCAAHLEEDAPNVEGGHGSVDLGEVGKPHAGGTT